MTKEELRNYRSKKLELDHLRYMVQKDSEDKTLTALYEEKAKPSTLICDGSRTPSPLSDPRSGTSCACTT